MGEREAAWEAQRQILVQDSERLREELSDVCGERDVYRLKMEASAPKSPNSSSSSGGVGGGDGVISPPVSSGVPTVKMTEYMTERMAFEAEIGELSITCNAVREELQTKEESIAEERR